MMPIVRVGVTGGIAEGKSTVLRYIRDLGIPTASADDIAREVFHSQEVQELLALYFDLPIPIDSTVILNHIRSDSSARRALNAITHPKILARIRKSEAIFFEVPLLVETCLFAEFDRIWVVTCGAEEQLARLVKRLGNEPEARSIIATQLPTEAKTSFADQIVRTNHSELTVKHFVHSAVADEIGE
jgi:dephospho-CoA kinase